MLKPFTGERFEPNLQGEIRLEHYHRYALALELVKGKSVLDLACGEGYGSYMLSKYATAVLGVDLSNEVIAHAKRKYANKTENLRFQQGSASKLSLQDSAFDVVVSYETIEHLYEQSEMLKEIRRVLKPDGILIISSPNKPVYSKNGEYQNHFHVKELDFSEFDRLLKKQFKAVEYFGQRLQIGSIIKSVDQNKDYFKAWSDDGKTIKPEAAKLSQPVYYIAVCAANSKYLPEVSPSVFYPNKLDLLAQYQGYAAWAKSTDIAIEEARRIIQTKEEEHQKIASWAKDLDSQLARSREQEQSLTAAREEAVNWARNLETDLKATQKTYQELVLEHEKTARWGQGLNTQLDEARRIIQTKEEEHQKIASWAKDLDSQLASSREEFIDILEAYETDLNSLEKLTWDFNRAQEIIVDGNRSIEHLNAEALNRDLQITQYSTQLSGVIVELGAANRALEIYGQNIHSLERSIEGKSHDISQLQGLIANRDQRIADLDLETVKRGEWALGLKEQLDARYAEIEQLNNLVEERNQRIADLDLETVKRGEWALGLIRELNCKQEELNQILGSNSWFITKPLREIRRWVFSPIRQVKRYLVLVLVLLKQIYQKLPFSYLTRNKHKALIGNTFPLALRLSNTSNNFVFLRSPKTVPVLNSRSLEIDFSLPTSSDPIVSVIIPIYGKVEFTLACLRSIAKYPPKTPFEVVVVDDCSQDDSADILVQVEGLKLYSNNENQGFIKSCNTGARISKGQYIYILNNDTEVTDGWLDNLYQTFSDFPGTGLAGSKLIYPDGTLQEAGGIIWRDGSAWNFGRNQDASLPVFNYAREVDYCSGASIMVPRKIFDDMCGFDERYLPAYYEDTDLALKIRQSGHRVIYQPLSTVIHHEGVSSGTDLTQGAKAYQVENQKKFFERWKEVLKKHNPNGVDPLKEKDRGIDKRVLVIDLCTPTPDQDSGSIDTFNIMLLLRQMEFQVTFIPSDNFLFMPKYTENLQRLGIEVLYAPYEKSVENHLKSHGNRYELAYLFRPQVANFYLGKIREHCPSAKIIFHTVDLHFLRMERQAKVERDDALTKAAYEMKRLELSLVKSADISTVLSEKEYDLLTDDESLAGKVRLLHYARDINKSVTPFEKRRDILFIGGFQHLPNIDAVKYFVSDVMPRLKLELPDLNLYVVGSNPTDEILGLATSDVKILGYVEDLGPLLDKVKLSIAPLRYGAGIKGKIGTSMSYGIPVVASSLAAEGMGLTDNLNILIADTPEAYVEKIITLYTSRPRWEDISSESFLYAEKKWGFNAAYDNLKNVLLDIGIQVPELNESAEHIKLK